MDPGSVTRDMMQCFTRTEDVALTGTVCLSKSSYQDAGAAGSIKLELQVEGRRQPHFESMKSKMDAREDPVHQEDAEITESCPRLCCIQELQTAPRSAQRAGQ